MRFWRRTVSKDPRARQELDRALPRQWHNGKSAPPKTPTDPFGIAPGISSAVEDDPHEVIIAESGRELVVHLVLVAGNDDEPARSRVRLPSPGRHPGEEEYPSQKSVTSIVCGSSNITTTRIRSGCVTPTFRANSRSRSLSSRPTPAPRVASASAQEIALG